MPLLTVTRQRETAPLSSNLPEVAVSSTKQVFHFSRVWGSRHGGSVYSEQLITELARRGWSVCVLAERFEKPAPNRVELNHFFRKDFAAWLRKSAEILRLSKLIARPDGALVIVQGDLPRLSYLLWQLFVPVIFLRQDAILTCPGANRLLPRTRQLCDQPLGLTCLQTHQREGCLRGSHGSTELGGWVIEFVMPCFCGASRTSWPTVTTSGGCTANRGWCCIHRD